MADFASGNIAQAPTTMSFNEKWEHYRPLLVRLYLDERLSLPKIRDIMRADYHFDAETHQYKYYFNKKWGLKKSISSKKKEAVLKISQARALQGHGTVATIQHRAVDHKKLKRYIRSKGRVQGLGLFSNVHDNEGYPAFFASQLVHGRMGLLNWDLPFKFLSHQRLHSAAHSPFSPSVSTPSDLSISTPPGNDSIAMTKTAKVNNASMLVNGQFKDLLRVLDNNGKRDLSTWMFQFRHFAFMTAKHWGRGPRYWATSRLWPSSKGTTPSSDNQFRQYSNVSSPTHLINSPAAAETRLPAAVPSMLCRWAIHVKEIEYEALSTSSDVSVEDSDRADDQPWPADWETPDIADRFQENLQNNEFSTLPIDSIPVAITQVARSISCIPDALNDEAIAFAIIGRNARLMMSLIHAAAGEKRALGHLFPLHLAARYLDGATTCCDMMRKLINASIDQDVLDIKPEARNPSGHTVLDSLFLTILRSHSSTAPERVDESFRGSQQFPGGEIDTCGRWDPESECYRELIKRSSGNIPISWKHKFCNTSIQAVCHSIMAYEDAKDALFNGFSGLFVKRCLECGKKLELPPLHACVAVAYLLGENGTAGEDLFGMTCCLFALVSIGSNLSLFSEADVSKNLLLECGTELCSHYPLTPAALAESLTPNAEQWPLHAAKVGWTLFCRVIRRIENLYKMHPPSVGNRSVWWADQTEGFGGDCGMHDDRNVFGNDNILGHVWVAMQAEVLNHRRIKENDPWPSARFDMTRVMSALDKEDPEILKTMRSHDVNPYCACGRFHEFLMNRRDHISDEYFSNMEDWHKTTFL